MSKEALKATAPRKWRSYLLGVWQRRQKQQPALRKLYDSKLSMAQALLQQWVTDHPDEALPVAAHGVDRGVEGWQKPLRRGDA